MAKLFELGTLVATPAVLEQVSRTEIQSALRKYMVGEWGDTSEDSVLLNAEAIESKDRIFAVYKDANETTFWIITDPGHEVTTILMPADY